jgi:hypothetical protein
MQERRLVHKSSGIGKELETQPSADGCGPYHTRQELRSEGAKKHQCNASLRGQKNNAIKASRNKANPKPGKMPGRGYGGAAGHHAAQKHRLAIGAHPVSGDLDYVRGRQ